MQDFKVFEPVYRDDLSPEQQRALITSRWVHRRKADNFVRSRLVCRGFTEQIVDKDDIYAGTPMLSSFRCLLTLSMSRGWEMYTGDVSTAFLTLTYEMMAYMSNLQSERTSTPLVAGSCGS